MAWGRTRTLTTALVTIVSTAAFFGVVKEARADLVGASGSDEIGYGVAGTSAQTEAWISDEAGYLSGRKLTVVCAANAQEWAQRLTEVGFPAAEADEHYGFSLIRRAELHLSPYVCEGLRLGALPSVRRSPSSRSPGR